MYEEMYRQARAYDVDVVVCGICMDDWPGHIEMLPVEPEGKIEAVSGIKACRYLITMERQLSNAVWNKLYRREFIMETGIRFSTEFAMAEDLLFSFESLLNAERCVLIGKKFYYYRKREESACNSKWHLKKSMDAYGVIKRIASICEDYGPLKRFAKKRQLDALLGLCLEFKNREFSGKEEKKRSLKYIQKEARKIPLGTAKGMGTNIRHLLLKCSVGFYIWVSRIYYYARTKKDLFGEENENEKRKISQHYRSSI